LHLARFWRQEHCSLLLTWARVAALAVIAAVSAGGLRLWCIIALRLCITITIAAGDVEGAISGLASSAGLSVAF
jgi:hypothetical protein